MKTRGKQTDRRVIRTKREILSALTKLIEQKSIDEITVREITDLAGINRGTFYLHYVDKYDLMEKSVNNLIIELRDMGIHIINSKEATGDSEERKEKTISSLTSIFEYVQENSRFIRSLLSDNSSYSFHHKFNEILKDSFIKEIQMTDPKIPSLYLATAISYAYQGLINTWLMQDMEESPRKMGEYGYEILQYFMVNATNNRV
ncbi:TetR/AcrR family transcriptional regulator [Jeotgalibaca sp. MA1X17-3]|uniref:TetR/AcrR family transcriptional regulator n=1 Tax=Jeotgalibaca sp. MA1X17-3 TaxID=2908211 RepID=UPI001F43DBB5|nr:TetR/AcrR family transcriptional regulator [Jeotgalibaca sp. MA1X17-3]UJF16130.1 TetR/AcrR family transcriptional regulator [Jeotgalibaca sp. MA1X17-3]